MIKAYACINLNDEERKNSSSGGIYPLLAKIVLSNNGIVFAACYDKSFDVCHRLISNEHELLDSQGSKYVASRLNETFKEIRDYLQKGIAVLFVGTTCQCEGLLSYLSAMNCERSMLTLIDFVCHGIPGRKAWHAFLKDIQKENKSIVFLNMRDKETGWTKNNYSWRIAYNNGTQQLIHQKNVSFMKGMLKNYYCRPSCYQCHFKGINRSTDITLGDYWGVWNIQPEMDDDKGTSLVLIHSEKGMELFESIKKEIKYKAADLNRAREANICIDKSIKSNSGKAEFYKMLDNGDSFERIIATLSKETKTAKISRKVNAGLIKLKKLVPSKIEQERRINRISSVSYLESGKQEDCVGCTACYSVCPRNAIEMIDDYEGFEYPLIKTDLCVNCNMCKKACPIHK